MTKRILAFVLAAFLCIFAGACSNNTASETSSSPADAETQRTDASEASQEGPDVPVDIDGASDSGFDIDTNVDVENLSMYVNMLPEAHNSYPYMGVAFDLPENFVSAVHDNRIFMYTDGDIEVSSTDISSAVLNVNIRLVWVNFSYVPAEVRAQTPSYSSDTLLTNDEYDTWYTANDPMARLAMTAEDVFDESAFQSDGFENHEIIGREGGYVFTWSSNSAPKGASEEEAELFAELPAIQQSIVISAPRSIDSAFSGFTEAPLDEAVAAGTELFSEGTGEFDTGIRTLDGDPVSSDLFAQHDLTLVNVWATWCSPCIQELPGLNALADSVQEKNVGVVGIVHDTASDSKDSAASATAVESANQIVEKLGLTFPNLIPTSQLLNALVPNLTAFPTSVFVNAEGKAVGTPMIGARSEEEWSKLVDDQLSQLEASGTNSSPVPTVGSSRLSD